ncbi:MAG TPA: PhzF family phenazine biosynthesis isomerase [Jatrophihabitantaceae bacterium]|jgi:PhzF family phenazine biosynthesis protein
MPTVRETTVFADGPGGGNLCPVVFDADGLADAQLQAMAARFGHETAFAVAPTDGADVRLRYFVPRHEMEMCVHATVAATVLLGRDGQLPRNPAVVQTPLGDIDVWWDAVAARALVAQFPPRFDPPVADGAAVLAALRSRTAAGEVLAVSTARPKLLVPLPDEAALDGLRPDFATLWALCDRLGATGLYAYTLAARGADAAARQFPVRAGYDEDPATGVAACALGAYLARGRPDGWHRARIAQGRAMGRPSIIEAEALVDAGTVTATRVGGTMTEDDARPGRTDDATAT